MMRVVRYFIIRAVAIILGVAVVLVILEAGVRFLGLFRFPGDIFVEPHSELGWFHIPNKEGWWQVGDQKVYVMINSKGLRDREYSYAKPEGTFRILVLGDSFTEGFQVPWDKTFAKVLEQRFRQEELSVEVLNCGFGGVGTDYALLFLKREGVKYDPDLILLAFFAGNDVQDNFRSRNILKNPEAKLAYEKRGLVMRTKQFLTEHSHAYNYLGIMIPRRFPGLARLVMGIGMLSPQPMDEGVYVEQLHYLVFADSYGTQWNEAWDVTEALLHGLKEEAKRCGARLSVVSIPLMEQVCQSLWQKEVSTLGIGNNLWDLTKPDRILGGILEELDTPFLALMPEMSRVPKSCELYVAGEGHWNVAGHRLAAQIIYRWLADQKLIPEKAE